MKILDSKYLEKIEEGCTENLVIVNSEFENQNSSISTQIDQASEEIVKQILRWLEVNLEHIHNHTECIVPLKLDRISKAIMKGIVGRQIYLKKRYDKLATGSDSTKKGFPLNSENLQNVRDNLLPMVAEVKILRDEVLQITKKSYNY